MEQFTPEHRQNETKEASIESLEVFQSRLENDITLSERLTAEVEAINAVTENDIEEKNTLLQKISETVKILQERVGLLRNAALVAVTFASISPALADEFSTDQASAQVEISAEESNYEEPMKVATIETRKFDEELKNQKKLAFAKPSDLSSTQEFYDASIVLAAKVVELGREYKDDLVMDAKNIVDTRKTGESRLYSGSRLIHYLPGIPGKVATTIKYAIEGKNELKTAKSVTPEMIAGNIARFAVAVSPMGILPTIALSFIESGIDFAKKHPERFAQDNKNTFPSQFASTD
jgi:hypothetical protein